MFLDSPWEDLFLNSETQDPTMFLWTKKDNQIRVPFIVYQHILEMCNESSIFSLKGVSRVKFGVLLII